MAENDLSKRTLTLKKTFDASRELDEALLSLNTFGYTLIIKAMKMSDNERRQRPVEDCG